MSQKKEILVLGAGFAGLTFAQKFRHPEARLTVVDQHNHHLFQPLLYQVATAGLAMPDVAEPVRTILSDRDDVRVVMDTVEQIDLEGKTVKLEHRTLAYDYLVIGLGMVTSYFGHDGWAEHSLGLKSLADARRIRERVLGCFERAEAIDDEAERSRLMTLVVAGGGPTGVEMAGALAELTRRVFKSDFRSIRPAEARILLVEGSDRVLGTYSEQSSRRAQKDLERMGVELHLGKFVKDIQRGRVTFGDETVESACVIWTAGVETHPVVQSLPVEHDRQGRILVAPDTSIPGHPEVFAIGDIASLKDPRGRPVPGVSPAAMQMAKHVARLLRQEIGQDKPSGKDRPAFAYWDKGSMATIGRSAAVAEIGKLRLSGVTAWFSWLAVHLFFLIGFRNRLAVLIQWFYAYLRYRPAARVFETASNQGFFREVLREKSR